MDLKKLDFKAIFEGFISFLTKLFVGVGAIDKEEDAPYKPYIDSAMELFDAVKAAMDK